MNDIQPLFVDGEAITAPMVATICSLAVGAGIVISNNDDLYDLGRMFYDYINKNNDLTLELVKSVFSASVSLKTDKLVSVKNDFLDIVKDFFDTTFSDVPESNIPISVFDGLTSIPITTDILKLNNNTSTLTYLDLSDNIRINYRLYNSSSALNGYNFKFNYNVLYYLNNKWNHGWGSTTATTNLSSWESASIKRVFYNGSYVYALIVDGKQFVIESVSAFEKKIKDLIEYNSIDFPYNGGYTWDNVESKKENESITLPIPGDLGQLVGQGSTDFWENTDGLVGSGFIILPDIENPSIDIINDRFNKGPVIMIIMHKDTQSSLHFKDKKLI